MHRRAFLASLAGTILAATGAAATEPVAGARPDPLPAVPGAEDLASRERGWMFLRWRRRRRRGRRRGRRFRFRRRRGFGSARAPAPPAAEPPAAVAPSPPAAARPRPKLQFR